ncbi:MAG: allophanate hydrolase subunit 1 [Alphaproteobacteria bacterium]
MIYDEPVFRPLGDRYLAIEFGDEANLLLNFRVLKLQEALKAEAIKGVIEVIPSLRELGIVFDVEATSHARLEAIIRPFLPQVRDPATLPSRYVRLPVWYDDPWSAETARRYEVEKNIDYVARLNNLTVEQVIETHTASDYWVVCVGFTPGCYFSRVLDPSKWITAPKYKVPRSFTPARTLALAGFSTGPYPVASPGGYQLIGRLAVNLYEPLPRNKAFPENGVLLRAGDRLRYYSVSPLEYDEIWDAVQRGAYDYEITEGVFDVAAYLKTYGSTQAASADD